MQKELVMGGGLQPQGGMVPQPNRTIRPAQADSEESHGSNKVHGLSDESSAYAPSGSRSRLRKEAPRGSCEWFCSCLLYTSDAADE